MKPLRLRASAGSSSPAVDRESGTIRGVAVITAGWTKVSTGGLPPMRVDATTLMQVAAAINAQPAGLRVRLTHPEVMHPDGDDLPHRIAWMSNARVDGDAVRADVTFYDPQDSAARRLLSLADRAPDSFGVSIVTETFTVTDDGALRISSLTAADLVGEPAANPAGLLSAQQGIQIMEYTDTQLEYLRGLGLPADASPEAIADFVAGLTPEQVAGLEALAGNAPVAADATLSRARGPSGSGDVLVLAERKRATQIVALAARAGLPDEWARQHIDRGTAAADAGMIALGAMGDARSPAAMQRSTSSYVDDRNGDSIAPAISDAIALRLGAKIKNPHPRAAEFRGRTMVEIGRQWLMAAGVHDAIRWSAAQVGAKLMKSRALALAQATGDFPGLLQDALGKSLRAAHAEYPSTWGAWCGRRVVADFKDIKRLALHSLTTPTEIPEGDEYTFKALEESKQTYALKTYGVGTKITRQALINDDLSAFDGLPQKAAQSCRRLEDDLAYAQITGNPTMAEDSVACFATAHANIGTGVLGNASVGAGRVKMAVQTDLAGSVLNLRPAFLLVPVELEDAARALVAAQELRQTGNTDATYIINTYSFLQSLSVVADPRLSADSAAEWYLAASSSQIDTVELAFLEGEETPVVEEENDFDTDVRKLKVRHTIAARVIDYRGLYRSSGA